MGDKTCGTCRYCWPPSKIFDGDVPSNAVSEAIAKAGLGELDTCVNRSRLVGTKEPACESHKDKEHHE